MKHLLLRSIEPSKIEDFLNFTDIEFEVLSRNNSFLNDMLTSARILHSSDKIVFKNVSPENENFLKLKFGNQIGDCDILLFDK